MIVASQNIYDEQAFSFPSEIAGHALIRCIGKGAYGSVWLARNKLTLTFRAIKIVSRTAFKNSKPYLREFDAIKKFEPISRSHEGFVQILHVGELEDAFYYIMELADDERSGSITYPEKYKPRTLAIQRGNPLPLQDCIQIGSRLAGCLSVLHQHQLIHRDIKPSNIIFVSGNPKLADIGLVAQIDEANSLVGTAGFVAPEGPILAQSDIFSLGRLIYEISTGKDRCEFPELPTEVSPESVVLLELNQILLRACHPVPCKRYPSAAAMQKELDLLHTGGSIKRLRFLEKRVRWLRAALAAFLIFTTAGFVTYSYFQEKAEQIRSERERRVSYAIARGTDEMKDGDLPAALEFFLAAAKEDPRRLKTHLLRIGSVAAESVRILNKWKCAENSRFSRDGRLLAVINGPHVQLFASHSGELLESNAFDFEPSVAVLSDSTNMLAVAHNNRLLLLDRSSFDTREHSFDGDIRNLAFDPTPTRLAVTLKNGKVWILNIDTDDKLLLRPELYVWNAQFDRTGDRLLLTDWENNTVQFWHTTSLKPVSPKIKQYGPYRGVFSPTAPLVVVCGWKSAVPRYTETGSLAGNTLYNDDAMVCAAFSPNGRMLATGSYDRSVQLWQADEFRPVANNHWLRHESRVQEVAFVGNETLVSHCTDGWNYVWDLASQAPRPEQVTREPVPDKLQVIDNGVNLLANQNQLIGTIGTNFINVSFEGKISALAANTAHRCFVVGLQDDRFEQDNAFLYRENALDAPIRLPHWDGITFVAFSHKGDKIVTCSEDYTARLWDSATGLPLTGRMRHSSQVHCAAFSSDDLWLVTGDSDGNCIVWDASSGDPLTVPVQFSSMIQRVRFDANDSALVAGNVLRTFRVTLPFATLPLEKYGNLLAFATADSR